jgi:hypothetical protein
VEALENPELQRRRGWNLVGWRYELISWGVRFQHLDQHGAVAAEILAVNRGVAASPDMVPKPNGLGEKSTVLILD